MELKEFIEQTFKDIIDGVGNAQEYAKTKKARVGYNKGGVNFSYNNTTAEGFQRITNSVAFEVVLTDSTNNGNNKGIGVSFGGFGAGYNKEKGGESTSCTKIYFAIPISFPEE